MRQGRDSGFQAPLWRAIAAYLIRPLVYATILVIGNFPHYALPTAAWPVLEIMAGWTVFTTYAYANPARRRPPLLVAGLVLTAAALAASVPIGGRAPAGAARPPLAVSRRVAAVPAGGVAGGGRGGIAAAVF